jgi:hypothetical protein
VNLRDAIKETGEYTVTVKLHREVSLSIPVTVTAEGGEATEKEDRKAKKAARESEKEPKAEVEAAPEAEAETEAPAVDETPVEEASTTEEAVEEAASEEGSES